MNTQFKVFLLRLLSMSSNQHSLTTLHLNVTAPCHFRCSLTAEEIVRRYNLGEQAEADESTSILMLDVSELPQLQNSGIWSKLAPSAKGCFHLYQMRHDDIVIR